LDQPGSFYPEHCTQSLVFEDCTNERNIHSFLFTASPQRIQYDGGHSIQTGATNGWRHYYVQGDPWDWQWDLGNTSDILDVLVYRLSKIVYVNKYICTVWYILFRQWYPAV